MTGGTSAPPTARRSSAPSLETTSSPSGKDAVGQFEPASNRLTGTFKSNLKTYLF